MKDDDSILAAGNRRKFLRQAACAAVGTAGMTNCLRDLHFMNAALAAGPYSDYKALVCIFLAGGNDSNNLFIPTIAGEYSDYANIRTPVLALPNFDGSPKTAQQLTPTSSDGHDYGMHPACYELAQMFNQSAGFNDLGGVAPVFNMGSLVYPMTKAQYVANTIAKPPQLFSHSDQVGQWQTSIPDVPPATGWGGRLADLLHSSNPNVSGVDTLSTCITLAGANTFEVGGSVQQYSVSSTAGVVALTNPGSMAARQTALNNILGVDKAHANYFTSSYAKALDSSVATGTGLSTAMTNTQMSTYWSTVANWSKTGTDAQVVTPNGGRTFTSSLMQQLRTVAKIIEAGFRPSGAGAGITGGGLGMKRQIFFVQVGGYDTHTSQTNNAGGTTTDNTLVVLGSQADLLAELSQSICAFQKAMKQIGITYGDANFLNRVTSFTASDFGRTFPSNGLGSDHGWGSHHFVVGGAVTKKQTYGTFPTLAVGGPDDTSTGRWIPTTGVDEYAATLARWMGVTSTSELAAVFPNLTRFASGSHAGGLGFMG
jgi:uncharacterized protein (DUF1501 family)